jgi:hypothetical protein
MFKIMSQNQTLQSQIQVLKSKKYKKKLPELYLFLVSNQQILPQKKNPFNARKLS